MNYHFAWKTLENGIIQGVYEQTIYGKTLAEACAYLESFHGKISVDSILTIKGKI